MSPTPESVAIEYESLGRSNAAFMAELEAAALRVLRSGWYVLGQEVASFETEFAAHVGARHCIGVANGLDALILSLEALELPRGSLLLMRGDTQAEWRHALPGTTRPVGARINLTFRLVRASAPPS